MRFQGTCFEEFSVIFLQEFLPKKHIFKILQCILRHIRTIKKNLLFYEDTCKIIKQWDSCSLIGKKSVSSVICSLYVGKSECIRSFISDYMGSYNKNTIKAFLRHSFLTANYNYFCKIFPIYLPQKQVIILEWLVFIMLL